MLADHSFWGLGTGDLTLGTSHQKWSQCHTTRCRGSKKSVDIIRPLKDGLYITTLPLYPHTYLPFHLPYYHCGCISMDNIRTKSTHNSFSNFPPSNFLPSLPRFPPTNLPTFQPTYLPNVQGHENQLCSFICLHNLLEKGKKKKKKK